MKNIKMRRICSVAICAAMLLSSALFLSTPRVSAAPDEWKEWSYDDFIDSPFRNNVAIRDPGGGDGYITLSKKLGWNNMTPDNDPGKREDFGFAFDSKNNVAILFGGWDGYNKLNDTWEYDYETNTWTIIKADGDPGLPPRRANCRMDYDSANEVIVLWGGSNETHYPLADTWEYDVDLKTWTEAKPISSPPAMGSFALAYDSLNSMILLAGTYEAPPGGSLHMYAYDANAIPREWVEKASTPYPRAGHDMAFNGQKMIVQGGGWGTMGEITYDDTLKYDYATDLWERYNYPDDPNPQRKRPGYITGNAMARYGINGVWDVGGYDGFMYKNDCWNFTGTGGQANDGWDWIDVTPIGEDPRPPECYKHGMVFDSYHKALILYGGYGDSGNLNETWVYAAGYAASGWYVSYCSENPLETRQFHDSGSPYTNWTKIWWNETSQPAGTKLKFQLQNDTDGNASTPPNTWFVGPDGTPGTFYENPGQDIGDHHDGKRFIRYKAFFEGIPSQTPVLEDVTIGYIAEGPPYIESTDPFDQETDVSIWRNITVIFSEQMNTGTLTWSINPDPCPGSWNEVWSSTFETDDTVTFEHPVAFDENTEYEVTITFAEDLDSNPLDPAEGEPNPWTFTTEAIPPWLVDTHPADGAINVPLDENISVNFSEPMNNTTVSWSFSSGPVGAPPLYGNWSNGNTTLYLTHDIPLAEGQEYTVHIISGTDLKGNPLDPDKGVPNPWRFWSYSDDPYVADQDPEHNDVDVPLDKNIIITFSEEMNVTTVTWLVSTIGWEGPPIDLWWNESWEQGNTVLNISHTKLFDENTQYWVNVTGGEDTAGLPLNRSKGLPRWWFTTGFVFPWIVSTNPFHGEIGVAVDRSIIVTFSEPMVKGTVEWNIAPYIDLTTSWNLQGTVLTFNHLANFLSATTYEVEITFAEDLDGNPLDPSKGAPNPWNFTTRLEPPHNLVVERSPPNDVIIRWNPVPGAIDGYHLYISDDRFAPWPLGWSPPMDIPAGTTEYTHAGALVDGLDHFYIVRAYKGFEESVNSTMGVKAHIEFEQPMNPWQFDIHWISLPYVSIYSNAIDIVQDIEGGLGEPSKIRFVARWNRDEQRTEFFYYSRGKWWGDPFDINPGDGIAIGGIMQNFAWYINGTDMDYELSFKQGHTDWISIPYTGIHGSASDIVIDIEGDLGSPTEINEVGKWNASGQKWEIYRWDGMAWTGDFTINVGDGIYLHTINDFNWTPKLLTPTIP